jgi:hypothetical protein
LPGAGFGLGSTYLFLQSSWDHRHDSPHPACWLRCHHALCCQRSMDSASRVYCELSLFAELDHLALRNM